MAVDSLEERALEGELVVRERRQAAEHDAQVREQLHMDRRAVDLPRIRFLPPNQANDELF